MNDKPIPQLVIETISAGYLGRCYNSITYKIKSLNRPLADSDIQALRDMGWLGYGQEFSFKRVAEEPADGFNKFYIVVAVDCVDSSD